MSNANMVPGKKSKGAGCLRWLGRAALGGVILLLGLAAIGAIYQAIASARDAKLYKPVDQIVEVDGIQMRLDCRGTGSPTVVLEAGAQGYGLHWWRVQEEVAQFTRVCSYDRPGYGWSDAAQAISSPEQVAARLHALLEAGGEQPPYLMVGHSFGGVLVRAFAAEYPAEVVGMVLVDSMHEHQNQRTPVEFEEISKIQEDVTLTYLRIFQVAAPLGLLRVTGYMDPGPELLGIPGPEKGPALAQMYRTGFFTAVLREIELMDSILSQPGALQGLGDMPLIVLSNKMDPQEVYDLLAPYEQLMKTPSQLSVEVMQEYVDTMGELQEELAALSTRGEHIIVSDTGHNIQLDAPEVVIAAIQEVFEQVSR